MITKKPTQLWVFASEPIESHRSMAMTQEPITIGGTDSIYKAYFSGLCIREYTPKYGLIYMVRLRTFNHFRILEISH
jgi:hypothetical protein